MAVIAGSTPAFVGAQHRDLHEYNLSLVLRLLRDEPASRAALATRSGLTPMTIGRLVSTLIELGLIVPGAARSLQRPGRPAGVLALNSQIVCYGLDITADDITMVELSLAGESHTLWASSLPHAPSPDQLAGVIATAVDKEVRKSGKNGKRVLGVGIAVPALVNRADQTIGVSASLGWRDVPLTEMVQSRLAQQLPVRMESRSKSHALAQADRAGRRGTVAHLEVSFTVGAGIVVDGTLHQGSRGYTGNIGHVPLDPSGPRCQCGKTGCLEALTGLQRLIELAGLGHPTSTPTGVLPRAAVLDQLATRADDGDPRTLAALQTAGHWLGVGCVNLLHTLDPDVISIGGYPVRLEHWILPHIRNAIDGLAQYDYVAAHELIMAPDESGVARGAATIVMANVFSRPLSTMLVPSRAQSNSIRAGVT